MVKKMYVCEGLGYSNIVKIVTSEHLKTLTPTWKKKYKHIYITDKDPHENVRKVHAKYKCSKCNPDAVCSKCQFNAQKGQYFADLESALQKDIKNFDEGGE